jgi:hypothetical protein
LSEFQQIVDPETTKPLRWFQKRQKISLSRLFGWTNAWKNRQKN